MLGRCLPVGILTAYLGSGYQLHNGFSLNITTWNVRLVSVTAIRHFHQGWLLYGIFAVLLFGYWLLSYVVLPAWWRHYEHHPKLQDTPKTTETAENIPGDPLNVTLVGTKVEVVQALLTIGWHPADPIIFQTSIAISYLALLLSEWNSPLYRRSPPTRTIEKSRILSPGSAGFVCPVPRL